MDPLKQSVLTPPLGGESAEPAGTSSVTPVNELDAARARIRQLETLLREKGVAVPEDPGQADKVSPSEEDAFSDEDDEDAGIEPIFDEKDQCFRCADCAGEIGGDQCQFCGLEYEVTAEMRALDAERAETPPQHDIFEDSLSLGPATPFADKQDELDFLTTTLGYTWEMVARFDAAYDCETRCVVLKADEGLWRRVAAHGWVEARSETESDSQHSAAPQTDAGPVAGSVEPQAPEAAASDDMAPEVDSDAEPSLTSEDSGPDDDIAWRLFLPVAWPLFLPASDPFGELFLATLVDGMVDAIEMGGKARWVTLDEGEAGFVTRCVAEDEEVVAGEDGKFVLQKGGKKTKGDKEKEKEADTDDGKETDEVNSGDEPRVTTRPVWWPLDPDRVYVYALNETDELGWIKGADESDSDKSPEEDDEEGGELEGAHAVQQGGDGDGEDQETNEEAMETEGSETERIVAEGENGSDDDRDDEMDDA
ncbi:hypothetical protein Rhopal_000753-T1 [Rhodotorula paludigena]|uniref:Uncharacterized protein n=1 Tax=Rhodotorula paludigena TaxID=86838 RepID=A0AAV5GBY0_9BASI|nr:hypothetical protein Rhopal_000753-T1 [Rhodotorula paludigena]